jgi:DNA-binding NarL/FixJ family response regulator
VLRLLAQGQQNKEIAATLAISERTVKFHVSTILEKLGAGNRTEAVARATQQGLVKREA